MVKWPRKTSKRLVLDIGTSAIRLCEISLTKAGYQLTRYMQRDVIVEPGTDEDTKKQLRAEALSDLLKTAKIRTKKVVFGVPGQSVFTRTRALPPVPEHKVTQIVRYEIQQQIPFSLDQIALDYQVLGRTDAGGYEVLMAAIKVDVVEKQLEVLNAAGRSIEIVDVCPLAAYNWLKTTGEFGDQGECVALLDLGATTTDIVIERGGIFRFTRSLSVGGNDITSAIASALNITFAEAEKLKRERGFAPTGDPQRDGKGGEIIGQVVSRLVTEVTRSFAYFRSQPGGGAVTRVILVGGGACLRNIVPYLQRQMAMEVRIAQPLAGLAIAPGAQEVNESPEQAATVLGLALRCNQTVPIEINLIPPRILEMARRKEQSFYWALSLATLALIIASIIPLQANQDKYVTEDIQRLRKILGQYDPALPANVTQKSEFEVRLSEAQSQLFSVVTNVETLDAALSNRIPWINYLVAVNEARPEGAQIVFHTIESTRIGQPKAASSEDKRAASKAKAEETKLRSRYRDESLTGGGGGASTLAPGILSSGFPGINSPASADSAGIGGGRRSNPRAAQQGPKVKPPEIANGLIIYGYAKDPDAIQLFVERLKANSLFDPNGITFNDTTANLVSAAELDNTPMPKVVGGPAAGSGGGGNRGRSRDDDGDRKGGFGSGLSGAFGGSAGGSSRSASSTLYGGFEETYTSFRIDAKFNNGEELKPAAPEAPQPPAIPATVARSDAPAPAADAPAAQGPLARTASAIEGGI